MRQLDRFSARLFQFRGRNHYLQGRFAEAILNFRQAVKRNPRLPDLHLALAYIYAKQGKIRDALQEIDKELRIVPMSRTARRFKEKLAARHASETLESQRSELATESALEGDELTAQLSPAAHAFYRGDLAEAQRLADERIQLDPRDSRAQVLLSRVLLKKKSAQRAFQELREAIIMDPSNVDALYYMLLLTTNFAQTEVTYLRKRSGRIHHLLAEFLVAQDRLQEAEKEYTAALEANPASAEVLVSLADLRRLQSRFEEARADYARALKIEPSNYKALYGLGLLHSREGDHEQAVKYLRQAVHLFPAWGEARAALGPHC